MKKILIDVLKESALEELLAMETDHKIRILNEDDIRRLSEQRDQIWKELEEYTYANIVKKVKESVG